MLKHLGRHAPSPRSVCAGRGCSSGNAFLEHRAVGVQGVALNTMAIPGPRGHVAVHALVPRLDLATWVAPSPAIMAQQGVFPAGRASSTRNPRRGSTGRPRRRREIPEVLSKARISMPATVAALTPGFRRGPWFWRLRQVHRRGVDMRYGCSGTWRSFTTAGGGPAGALARPRALPRNPTAREEHATENATRIRSATCIGFPEATGVDVHSELRRLTVLTRQPLAERVRVRGQGATLRDRRGHWAAPAAFAPARRSGTVVPATPRMRRAQGRPRWLAEQVPLDRQPNRSGVVSRLRRGVAPPTRVEGARSSRQVTGRRCSGRVVHAAPPGGVGEVVQGSWRLVGLLRHCPTILTTSTSSTILDPRFQWYPVFPAAGTRARVPRRPAGPSSDRRAGSPRGECAHCRERLSPLQLWQTSILRVCSPASGVRLAEFVVVVSSQKRSAGADAHPGRSPARSRRCARARVLGTTGPPAEGQ